MQRSINHNFEFIQQRCAQPRHRALLKRRSLFVSYPPEFLIYLFRRALPPRIYNTLSLKKGSRNRWKSDQKSMKNPPGGTKINKNHCLGWSEEFRGAILEPSGPPGPPRCTLGSQFFVRGPAPLRFRVQIPLFSEFICAVFSRRPPELEFIAFGTILKTFWEAFRVVFGTGWKV